MVAPRIQGNSVSHSGTSNLLYLAVGIAIGVVGTLSQQSFTKQAVLPGLSCASLPVQTTPPQTTTREPLSSVPSSSADSLSTTTIGEAQAHWLEILTAEGSKQAAGNPPLGSYCDLLQNGFAYNKNIPTTQNAADILEPWFSVLPDTPQKEHLKIGHVGLFSDQRVTFLLDRVPVEGKHILELGPLEAGHSYMLHQAGAHVTGIEGSPLGYLKTLLIKNTYDLTNFKPLFGNFVAALEIAAANHIRFDAVVAVGVIYHMTEPMKVLHLLSQVTDTILIWTHFYHPDRAKSDTGRIFDSNAPPVLTIGDWSHSPHCFQYPDRKGEFIGGQEGDACLLERKDLLGALEQWGFSIDIQSETVEGHPGGPQITFLARRN